MKQPREKQVRRATMAQMISNTTPCTTTSTSPTIQPVATNSIATGRNKKSHSTCTKATRRGSPPTMMPRDLAGYTNLIPTRSSPLADYYTAVNRQQWGINRLLHRRASTGMLGVVYGGGTDSLSPQSDDAAVTGTVTLSGMTSSPSVTIATDRPLGGDNFVHLTKEEKVERIVADPLQWSKLQRELRKSEGSFRCAPASFAANHDSDAIGSDGRIILTTSMAVRQRMLASSLLDERLYEMERLKIALRETNVEEGDDREVTSPESVEGRPFMRKFASARRAGRRATMHF